MGRSQLGEQYIKNLRRVRELARPQIDGEMSDEALLAHIQQNAAESFSLMKECNSILDELIFHRVPEQLTDEDIASLRELADKLFSYASSEDAPVAYQIHCLLLKAARARGDAAMTVRELYSCGVTLYYSSTLPIRYAPPTFGQQVRDYFSEGAGYVAQYEQLDRTARDYVMRCIGNCKMCLPRDTLEDCREYLRVWDQSMAILSSPYYRQLDPDLPWASYEYAMYIDMITLNDYFNNTSAPDQELVHRAELAADYVYRNNFLTKPDDMHLQNWRIEYFYLSSRYFAGKGTSCSVVERLLDVIESTDPRDYSPRGIRENLSLTAYVLTFQPRLSAAAQQRLGKRITAAIERGAQYIEHMPGASTPRLLNIAMRGMVDMLSESSDENLARRRVFDYLLAGHRPTYIHSLMVAAVTRALIRQQLKVAPEGLIGLCGYTTVEQLQAHAGELAQLAYECGLYHDIGKSMVLMYIGTNARRLMDLEFACIKQHPLFGYKLLCRMGREKDLAQAALYHHSFYNGEGGYPGDFGPCPADIKGIVDALTVADSLDAATDGIGRCYNIAKPFEALAEEFRAQSGTRYSPAVAALFSDEAFSQWLKNALFVERQRVYIKVYRTPEQLLEEEVHAQ